MVQLVAHRSPKPTITVRIRMPLLCRSDGNRQTWLSQKELFVGSNPTSSTTNACIGMANVGFVDWFKYAIRMFAVQAAIGTVFVAIAYFINL